MTATDTNSQDIEQALAQIPDDEQVLERSEFGAVAELNRSEIETQMDAAHRYKRSTKRFLQEAMTLATLTKEIAESCIYTLPRAGKPIVGPSVRLAEICASTYENLHVGARPMEVGHSEVVSQGVAWDLQKNYRVTIEAKRRITNKSNVRFNEDMIQVTHAAATSIAFRNAIFRVIPRAYVEKIYAHVKKVAIGDARTLEARRVDILDSIAKMGVEQARVLAAVGKAAVEDVGLEELEVLVGLRNAVRGGEVPVDQAFPGSAPAASEPPAIPEGKKATIEVRGRRGRDKAAEKAPEPKKAEAEPPPQEDRGDDPDLDPLRRVPPPADSDTPPWGGK